MNKVFKVGLIGCGHISETYFRAEKYFNNIKIVKCADINHGNALKCAKIYKIKNGYVESEIQQRSENCKQWLDQQQNGFHLQRYCENNVSLSR